MLRGEAACRYGRAADLWAVGVVAYVLLSGRMPFSPSTYLKSCLATLTFRAEIWQGVSPEAVSFVSTLIQLEPNKRLSAAEALRHTWLQAIQTSTPTTVDPNLLLRTPEFLRELRASNNFAEQWDHNQRLSASALIRSTSKGRAKQPSPSVASMAGMSLGGVGPLVGTPDHGAWLATERASSAPCTPGGKPGPSLATRHGASTHELPAVASSSTMPPPPASMPQPQSSSAPASFTFQRRAGSSLTQMPTVLGKQPSR